MDLCYFQKINNTFKSQSSQETDLFLLNRHVEDCFADSIDYHKVKRNGEDFELIITKDTDSNTQKKKIKSRPSQPFNLGDYIDWNGQIWLVTLLDTDDKTYHSGYMYLCTILLRYQNSKGELVERWSYAEDYTKYSIGETGNSTIIVGDYQYGITVPSDEEMKKLKRGTRFVIDYDGNYPPDVYRLTNRKAYLSDANYFNRGGVMTFTLSYDFFDAQKDKLVTIENGSKVWLCDYYSPTDAPIPPSGDETPVLSAFISGGNTLRCGRSKTWTAAFKNKDGEEVTDCVFKWNVLSDFNITQTLSDNKIQLRVDDEDYISSSFLLQIKMQDIIVAENEITIIEGF